MPRTERSVLTLWNDPVRRLRRIGALVAIDRTMQVENQRSRTEAALAAQLRTAIGEGGANGGHDLSPHPRPGWRLFRDAMRGKGGGPRRERATGWVLWERTGYREGSGECSLHSLD